MKREEAIIFLASHLQTDEKRGKRGKGQEQGLVIFSFFFFFFSAGCQAKQGTQLMCISEAQKRINISVLYNVSAGKLPFSSNP